MKIFRLSGVNRSSGAYEAFNVQAADSVMAIKLASFSHIRVVCCDKRGLV